MRLTIRIAETNKATVDLSVDVLDVSKVPAALAGSPTTTEVIAAVQGKIFDGTVFPKQ